MGTAVTNQNVVWDNGSGQSINVQSSQVSPLPVGFNATANGTYCGSVTKTQGAIGVAKLFKVMARDVLSVSIQVTYSSATVDNAFGGVGAVPGAIIGGFIGGNILSADIPNKLYK
ncbi:MAG TPA: hypothetical protein VHW43_02805 [Puia sp.]|nr:hypothetical protein [Puia sp.]